MMNWTIVWKEYLRNYRMNRRKTKKIFKKAVKLSDEPRRDIKSLYRKAGGTMRKMGNWL